MKETEIKSPHKITHLYAFVADNGGAEGEGIVSMQIGDTHMPLIGSDMARVEYLKPYAKSIAEVTGKKVYLKKFVLQGIEYF